MWAKRGNMGKVRYAVAGIALAVPLSMLVWPVSQVGAANDKSTVLVGNTDANPVPVTGNVKAAQSGPWNVGITGTPHVVSAPDLPAAPFGQTAVPSLTVPAGKHLTIETVSLDVDVKHGNTIEAFVNYTSGGNSVQLFVPVTFVGTEPSNFDDYMATQAVRLYADPGTTVSVTAFSPSGGQGSTGTLFLSVSGFLT